MVHTGRITDLDIKILNCGRGLPAPDNKEYLSGSISTFCNCLGYAISFQACAMFLPLQKARGAGGY